LFDAFVVDISHFYFLNLIEIFFFENFDEVNALFSTALEPYLARLQGGAELRFQITASYL